MHEKTKQYLGWAAILTLLVVAWSGYTYARAYQASVVIASNRSISVSADAKVVAVPDVATFSLGVITQGGKDLTAIQKENTTKSNKIIAFIKSKGVTAKDIQTEQYSVNPRYQTSSCYNTPTPMMMVAPGSPSYPSVQTCPPSVIVGYEIDQSISVKVRNFATIGDLLSGVVSGGANNVSSINFTIDDPDSLRAEAREKAIAKALTKARAIARAGGFRLGNVVSFDEGLGGYRPEYYSKSMAMAASADMATAPSPAIEPGSQEIVSNVTIRYEIQ